MSVIRISAAQTKQFPATARLGSSSSASITVPLADVLRSELQGTQKGVRVRLTPGRRVRAAALSQQAYSLLRRLSAEFDAAMRITVEAMYGAAVKTERPRLGKSGSQGRPVFPWTGAPKGSRRRRHPKS